MDQVMNREKVWDWQREAACKDTTVHLMPDNKHAVKAQKDQAKAICAACPVFSECRTWARAVDRVAPWSGVVVAGIYYGQNMRDYRRRQAS